MPMCRISTLLVILALACVGTLALGCCGGRSAMPAMVIRSPIDVQMESRPETMRVAPAYSVPQWSQPQVAPRAAPQWVAPRAANPCAPQYAN